MTEEGIYCSENVGREKSILVECGFTRLPNKKFMEVKLKLPSIMMFETMLGWTIPVQPS